MNYTQLIKKTKKAHDLAFKKYQEEKIKYQFGAKDETIEEYRIALNEYESALEAQKNENCITPA